MAVAEGALRPPASMLVGKDSTRHVRAIVDLLGFGDFSVRLITDDGDGIDGHYESHEDFAALAEQLQNRETHSFEVVTRIDDRGKSRNVVRLSSRSQ